MTTLAPNFRFVEVSRLDTALGHLDGGVRVQTANRLSLGRLVGAVVDPDQCRVHYLVVAARSWFKVRRLLVPLRLARLTPDRRAIEVDVREDEVQTAADDSVPVPDFFPPPSAGEQPHAA